MEKHAAFADVAYEAYSAASEPSARAAARVAAYSATAASDAVSFSAAAHVAKAVRATAYAYSATARTAREVRFDFELLRLAAARNHWTDETSVSPNFFGPMWPEGTPKGWPVRQESDAVHLMAEVGLPAGITAQQVEAIAANLADKMDKLHRAYGGNGLTIDRIEIDEPAGIRVGVPA